MRMEAFKITENTLCVLSECRKNTMSVTLDQVLLVNSAIIFSKAFHQQCASSDLIVRPTHPWVPLYPLLTQGGHWKLGMTPALRRAPLCPRHKLEPILFNMGCTNTQALSLKFGENWSEDILFPFLLKHTPKIKQHLLLAVPVHMWPWMYMIWHEFLIVFLQWFQLLLSLVKAGSCSMKKVQPTCLRYLDVNNCSLIKPSYETSYQLDKSPQDFSLNQWAPGSGAPYFTNEEIYVISYKLYNCWHLQEKQVNCSVSSIISAYPCISILFTS